MTMLGGQLSCCYHVHLSTCCGHSLVHILQKHTHPALGENANEQGSSYVLSIY